MTAVCHRPPMDAIHWLKSNLDRSRPSDGHGAVASAACPSSGQQRQRFAVRFIRFSMSREGKKNTPSLFKPKK